jgi:hypothetical protein
MFRLRKKILALNAVFITGLLIGGLITPELLSYNKGSEETKAEKQDKKKPKHLRDRLAKKKRIA